MQLQPHPGRVPAHLPQQQIGQDRDRVVRCGHRELPVRVSRVEPRRPLHGRLHLPQRVLHGRQQLLAEDGQPVTAPLPLKQLIPEVLAQPGQRHAHGRLADPDPPPGSGQVPLLKQRPERDQQVQVDLAHISHRGCPSTVAAKDMTDIFVLGIIER